MNEFEWIEEQCQYTEHDVKWIKDVCKYFGHRTIQSYVDKLKDINRRNKERLERTPKTDIRKITHIEYRIESLETRLPILQLMADTYPEDLYKPKQR